MMIVFRGQLVRGGMRLDAARAVEGRVVHVVDDGPVVYVGDVNAAHIHGRTVIEIRTPAPIAAFESNTTIAEAVIHAAVKADMRAPIAAVPGINTTSPTPVARRPQ
jgi:hypothetical protein